MTHSHEGFAEGRVSLGTQAHPVRSVVGHGHDHAVQFYEDETFLTGIVSRFLAGGLHEQQPVVVIATPEHRASFAAGLLSHGIDVRSAQKSGRLTTLDARDTLSRFMTGRDPDRERFRAVIGQVIEESLGGRDGNVIRAYGEMVDLLWKDGNTEGAIQLEEMWNELAQSYKFSLLCAYSMGNFYRACDTEPFRRICGQHSHVAPSEAFVHGDDNGRLVDISVLQQRSKALEFEIVQRELVEQRLRDALISVQEASTERERLLARERAARADAERAREEADRARATAEQANRAKSDFLAVMSHELRTPLNAIGGHAELMELGVHGPVSPQQRDALDRIQRSQRILLGHINQVLNYARVETGNVRFEITDIPLDEMIRGTEALVLPQLRASGLRYVYGGCATDVSVRADGEKLQQILLNLLTNAIKFTPRDGEIRVDVELTDQVLIRVRDTGIGIPHDKLGVIFDPFVQIDAQYTRTRDGVGLGLAISRDLAKGMAGDVVVESAQGKGSTFTLRLVRAD